MLSGLVQKWQTSRAASEAVRQEKAAVQRKFEQDYADFLAETKLLLRKETKHPKAALFRHAWKRSCVLQLIFQSLERPEAAAFYDKCRSITAASYYRVAPETRYGKARLIMEEKAGLALWKAERNRLFPSALAIKKKPLACIYMGVCAKGRSYIGQTTGAPELRFQQHRTAGTGPLAGDMYAKWEILEGPLNPKNLDERESYYIGFYDAKNTGHNQTIGNHPRAYEQGQADRKRMVTTTS